MLSKRERALETAANRSLAVAAQAPLCKLCPKYPYCEFPASANADQKTSVVRTCTKLTLVRICKWIAVLKDKVLLTALPSTGRGPDKNTCPFVS